MKIGVDRKAFEAIVEFADTQMAENAEVRAMLIEANAEAFAVIDNQPDFEQTREALEQIKRYLEVSDGDEVVLNVE